MKVTTLKIKNIGMIADETIKLDKPLILFYGEIRQGKSTILNAVRWVCGGSFPADIIRHGQQRASIELGFANGSISREWYVGKDGSTKAMEIVFVREGKKVPKPATEIQKLLNPFLIDQNHLANMSELERTRYFVDLFGADTKDIDGDISTTESAAKELRAKIKGYGNIDLSPVETVDVATLRAQLNSVRNKHSESRGSWQVACSKIQAEFEKAHDAAIKENQKKQDHKQGRAKLIGEAENIQRQIDGLRKRIGDIESYLAANPESELLPLPPYPEYPAEPSTPDTTVIEQAISEAGAQNVKAQQYADNRKRASARDDDSKTLLELERQGKELKASKASRLQGISLTCGIEGLAFDENGHFAYQGIGSGMLSTSQIMRLSSELSAMYPEGFGLELLDRAESLGKSIFGFIERAKREDKTILATIVGERPASSPPECGVFVVENGKIV